MTSTATAERITLVTGGAGGIGAAICTQLATEGATVVVTDLEETSAANVVDELPAGDHIALGMDVSNTEDVRSKVALVNAELGPIDVLINVAGWDRFVPFVDTTPEFWDHVIAVNYRGTLNTTHAVLPSMIERGNGRIVSVASDAARVGSSLESIYSGAKGAVISFSKSVAREVARHGITVNVVCPGPTDTPLIRTMADELGNGDRFMESLTKAIPMRRLADPEDIAPAVVFLASDGARYITGQTLSVSGGLTMA